MMYRVRFSRVHTFNATADIEAKSKEHAEHLAASAVNCLQNGMIVEVNGPLEWKPVQWEHTYEVLPRI